MLELFVSIQPESKVSAIYIDAILCTTLHTHTMEVYRIATGIWPTRIGYQGSQSETKGPISDQSGPIPLNSHWSATNVN